MVTLMDLVESFCRFFLKVGYTIEGKPTFDFERPVGHDIYSQYADFVLRIPLKYVPKKK